jgi:hypothetical protein
MEEARRAGSYGNATRGRGLVQLCTVIVLHYAQIVPVHSLMRFAVISLSVSVCGSWSSTALLRGQQNFGLTLSAGQDILRSRQEDLKRRRVDPERHSGSWSDRVSASSSPEAGPSVDRVTSGDCTGIRVDHSAVIT